MSTLPDVIRANHPLQRAIAACLAGLSPNTQKSYKRHIARFQASGSPLTREGVSLWLQAETERGLGSAGHAQALAALKRLSEEASQLGWMDYETARQIGAIKGRKVLGVRTGNWLTLEQVRQILALPDRSTLIGQRDACVLALLTGCGLRREEACRLEVHQLVESPTGLVLANVRGKGERVRTVGVPSWAAREIQAWLKVAEINEGKILRSMR